MCKMILTNCKSILSWIVVAYVDIAWVFVYKKKF